MPSKKQARRKLDLTHLGSLNTSTTSEPQQVEAQQLVDEPVVTNVVETKEAPPTEAPPTEPTPERKPEPVVEAPVENRKFDRRPQRYEAKPLSTLESYKNADGDNFKLGDKIKLFAPWGKSVIAEISLIYHDESRNVWVQYIPTCEIPPNWSWLGGCSRAERIVLVN